MTWSLTLRASCRNRPGRGATGGGFRNRRGDEKRKERGGKKDKE